MLTSISPALSSKAALQARLETWACWFCFGAIFLLPFSHALMRDCVIAAVIASAFSGHWAAKWALLQRSPIIMFGLALVFLYFLGMTYSEASWPVALHGFFERTKIVYIIFLMPLFKDSASRRLAVSLLLCGVFLHDLISTAAYFTGWQPLNATEYDAGALVNPLGVSVLTVFSIYALFHRIIDDKSWRGVNIALMLFFTYYLLFINREKVGALILLVNFGLLLWQRLGRKGLFIAILAVPLTLGGLYAAVPPFRAKMVSAAHSIRNFQHNIYTNSSVGLRLEFIKYGLKLVRENPLTGSGSGSFTVAYARTHGPPWPRRLHTPHNEYTMIAVELGIIGLLGLLAWMGAQFLESFYLPLTERYLAQTLVVSFVIACACFSALLLQPAAYLYIIFLSVFYAPRFFKAGDFKSD